MHLNLYAGTLDVFPHLHHARLWWKLDTRQCWAEVTLTPDRLLDLGQSGWVVFKKTYNRAADRAQDDRLLFHEFEVRHLCEVAHYLSIDLFDLNYLTA